MEYIQGMDKLLAKLNSLKKTVAKKAINKACRTAGKMVQAVAKRLTPKGSTGLLERGIKVRAIPRSRIWTGVNIQLQIVTVPYASFEELGTKFILPRGFLKQAAKQTKSQAISMALELIKTDIENL